MTVLELPSVQQPLHAAARVLVVDDHPVNRMVMRVQLERLGYAAEDAEGGAEAFARWQSGSFALVLTDLMMPQISGYDLARRIREAEAATGQPRMPIIACSANVTKGTREACQDAGMDDFIAKPTELLPLSEIVDRWLHPGKDGGAVTMGAESPEAPPRVPPLERHAAVGGTAGGDAAEQAMLAHFRRINDSDAARLAAAVEQRDLAAIAYAAHRIKGACGFVGATALGTAAAGLEQAGRAGEAGAIAGLMREFANELERLNAFLNRQ